MGDGETGRRGVWGGIAPATVHTTAGNCGRAGAHAGGGGGGDASNQAEAKVKASYPESSSTICDSGPASVMSFELSLASTPSSERLFEMQKRLSSTRCPRS